ncbi:MAG: hypothetical protein V3U84_04605 [Thiotrichaceae bacterium]
MTKRKIGEIGIWIGFGLAISAYIAWLLREARQFAIFAEPDSFIQAWLRVLAAIGIIAGGIIAIVALFFLISTLWREKCD